MKLLSILLFLAGCGGGNATSIEIAEADAAVHQVTVQPVMCTVAPICQ